MDQLILDNKLLLNYLNIDIRIYSIGTHIYHYYNRVDLNKSQQESDNLHQLNQMDNNNDNLLNLFENNYRHSDNHKEIFNEDDNQYMQLNLH